MVDPLDPGSATYRDTAGRKPSDLTEFQNLSAAGKPAQAVILTLGASNIANEGDPAGRHTPRAGVHNFNFLDGNAYVAQDPLLGATRDRGNFLSRLADLLVVRSVYRSVLLVPLGHGASFAADWAPGGRLHPRLTVAIEKLRQNRVSVTHILYQQGEAEAAVQSTVADGKTWEENFLKIAASLRYHGLTAPIYVSQCTVCRNQPNPIIRGAQRAVVRPEDGILPGPDTDVIGIDQRWDGCHFSIAGLDKAAELWFDAIVSR